MRLSQPGCLPLEFDHVTFGRPYGTEPRSRLFPALKRWANIATPLPGLIFGGVHPSATPLTDLVKGSYAFFFPSSSACAARNSLRLSESTSG